jgi:ribosomal protein S18 acetylase RimI-like enzyme
MPTLADHLRQMKARAPDSADDDFLARLYGSTRDDLRALATDPALVASLIAMQQRLQAAGYRNAYPGAEYLVLHDGATPVARIVVDVGPAEIRLVDIAVLPAARRRGFGSQVVRALQRCASDHKLALALSVHHNNPDARRWYLALGFQPGSRNAVAEQLIWKPDEVG